MTTDPKTEAWLNTHHVTYTYTDTLELGDVDTKRSLANQARLEALDEDTVDKYTLDYQRGDQFPPLLAMRTSPRAKKIVLLGGNHRFAAATAAGHTTHCAYIIDQVEPETAIVLALGDNLHHGKIPPKKERILQAVHLVNTGWQQRRAAAELSVHEVEVSVAVHTQASAARARELGIAGYDTLTQSAQLELGRLTLNKVFEAACKVSVACKLTGPDTKTLCKALKDAPSESAALDRIADEYEHRRETLQATAGGKSKTERTHYGRTKSIVMAAIDLDPNKVIQSLPAGTEARKNLRDQIRRSVEKLADIDRALAKAN